MRTLWDGFWLHDGPTSNRTVLIEQVRAWARAFPDDEVVMLVPKRTAMRPQELGNNVSFLYSRLTRHPLINFIGLPLAQIRRKYDAVITHNFASPGRRSWVFVHDVLFQSNPNWFTFLERRYLWLSSASLRLATGVFTSSETEKIRIEKYNEGVDVYAVGLGLSSDLALASPMRPRFELLPGSFMLSVGRLNVRKNLGLTIKGALASGLLSAAHPLVVVGEASGKSTQLNESIRTAQAEGSLVFSGFVSTAELRWLYENCAQMVFLSLDEGFGLPPLEALAFGAPVLASDRPVFHETLGDRATFVDPLDPQAIAAAVRSISRSPRGVPVTGRQWPEVVIAMRERVLASVK